MTVVFEALQRTHAGVGGVFHTGLFQPNPHELHITKPLPVLSGYIPSELDGYYMRTGPNPQFDPIGGCELDPVLTHMKHRRIYTSVQAASHRC